MWTTFFTIAMAAAIGFGLAAAWMSPQIGMTSRPRKNRSPLITEFAAGCRELTRTACGAFEPNWKRRGDAFAPPHSDALLPSLAATALRDASPLLRRMRHLHINPDELAWGELAVFRQLAIRCGQCMSTAQCTRDLSDESADPFGEDWRDYCPNASMLSMLSTLHNVGISLDTEREGSASSMHN